MLPLLQSSDTTIAYLPAFRKRSYALYWVAVLMAVVTLACLPFIHTTIAVTAQGVTRPQNERTEVRPLISGMIDALYFKEGSHITKGDILLRIKDRVTPSKKILNNFEINQREQFIHDLEVLTTSEPGERLLLQLSSPLYRAQLSKYLHQKADQETAVKKAGNDLDISAKLASEKVIARKELFDTQAQYDRANAGYKAFTREQQSNWQQQLSQYRLELSQYRDQLNQVNIDASYYEVKAPVSGTLQGINDKYTGSLIQPDKAVCTISPDGSLLGECYVLPKDIGLIKAGQQVHFQIDAFNYNYFGVLTGKVTAIDNDYTFINTVPLFKVRCSFDTTQLHLKNGFSGHLQKGLTFQSRFVIGERTLWQLLWDKIDDWLNPAAPANKS
ncbi:MAG: HlyD family efflux transporter periplasmic adaptor subunit [Niabella sp.]|nr:HlyD family efflux transporter periplasmic adaptor subunit [Niabella sp.]